MRYFKLDEFNCNCGCGKNNMYNSLLKMLERARYKAGIPFVITSGTRCATHNKKEGGSPTSSHLTGHASDIACNNSLDTFKMINALLHVGFTRIGIAKSFIHVDNDPNKNQFRIWTY